MGEGRYRAAAVPRPGRRRATTTACASRSSTRSTTTSTPPRSPRCSPTPTSRSSCTPAARTSRCCAASGRPRCATIFDTQVAAGFAGLRAQLGYEALLHELLGVRLRKSASFTRWDARPLSEEQVDYAREDVLHLLAARRRAAGAPARPRPPRLGARGVPRARGRLRRARRRRVFARLPRVNSLDPGQRAVARELVAWREETRARGGPPGVERPADAALVEIAKRRPPIARAPGPDPRPQRGHAAPPRAARSSTRSSAAASATRSRSTASARRRPTRATRR